jgi:hypothetical protein
MGLFSKPVPAAPSLPFLSRPDLAAAAGQLPATKFTERVSWGYQELEFLDLNLDADETVVAITHYTNLKTVSIQGIAALTDQRIIFVSAKYNDKGLFGEITTSTFELRDLTKASARKGGKVSVWADLLDRSDGRLTFFAGATSEHGQWFMETVQAEVNRRQLGGH